MIYTVYQRPIFKIGRYSVYGDEPLGQLKIDGRGYLCYDGKRVNYPQADDDIIIIVTPYLVEELHSDVDSDASFTWGCYREDCGYVTIIVTNGIITTVAINDTMIPIEDETETILLV